MGGLFIVLICGLLPVVFFPTEGAHGQGPPLPDRVTTSRPGPLPVPFGPGELLTYQIKYGIFSVGEGHMQVSDLESIRGKTTYHLSMAIRGGVPLYRVDDLFQSWIGVEDLVSRRFIKDQHEGGRRRFEHWEFFPGEERFERRDKPEKGSIPTMEPLDDVSFLYFARSLPLEVGDEYTLDRYYTERGNPVVIRVLRRDTVEVPAGTFPTIVVQPTIQTDGLFGDGGRAEVHFTDDDRRLMVYMRASVPIMGSLSLHLKTIVEGRRLTAPPGMDGQRTPGVAEIRDEDLAEAGLKVVETFGVQAEDPFCVNSRTDPFQDSLPALIRGASRCREYPPPPDSQRHGSVGNLPGPMS